MDDTQELSYGQESKPVLIGIFAVSTVIGAGLGYWLAPDDIPLWRTVVAGAALGFHAAMYPYFNRLMMA